jgi:hypothetical protein
MSDPEPMVDPMDQEDRQIKKESAAAIGELRILNCLTIIFLRSALTA